MGASPGHVPQAGVTLIFSVLSLVLGPGWLGMIWGVDEHRCIMCQSSGLSAIASRRTREPPVSSTPRYTGGRVGRDGDGTPRSTRASRPAGDSFS